jgi:hypothetical protein
MYFIVMLNVDDNRLSEDQKRLVAAFNAAANYFHDRLLGKVNDVDETLQELALSLRSEQEDGTLDYGQANSKIAEESYRSIIDSYGFNEPFLQAIKFGGNSAVKPYFLESILATDNQQEREQVAEDCRKKILVELLAVSTTNELLPQEYLQEQAERLNFIPKP